MSVREQVVFLLDVDNTLLDNDKAQADYLEEIERICGPDTSKRYWMIFQDLVKELGYADYLGALQRYRLEDMHDPRLLRVSSFLLDYPFADRLYPQAVDLITALDPHGTTAILTDGDVVFQPRKIERSGLWSAVGGRVLVYIHKENELDEVEQRYPAEHYVLVDDKLRILDAVKRVWGERVTTVFPRQGHYAVDPMVLATYPGADISINHVADLRSYSLAQIIGASRNGAAAGEATAKG